MLFITICRSWRNFIRVQPTCPSLTQTKGSPVRHAPAAAAHHELDGPLATGSARRDGDVLRRSRLAHLRIADGGQAVTGARLGGSEGGRF